MPAIFVIKHTHFNNGSLQRVTHKHPHTHNTYTHTNTQEAMGTGPQQVVDVFYSKCL